MKLYVLGGVEPIDGYDVARGFVVRAKTQERARAIAARRSGDNSEIWFDAKLTYCRPLSSSGDEELILRDYRSGLTLILGLCDCRGGMQTTMPAPPVAKTCGCGRHFEKEAWEALDYVGLQRYEWGEVQEMRNCFCGSTIVIILEPGTPERL